MTPADFQTKCTAWISDENNASPEAFAAILTEAFTVLGMYQRDLAVEFEVAESTVSRWAKGTARPHPRIQKQIVRSLSRRAGKLAPKVQPATPAVSRNSGTTNPGIVIPWAAKPR